MRPLTSSDSAPADSNARVWRVSQKHNSVTQTTAAGEPLPERVKGRNFFTFDKTFGEDASTKQVYDSVAGGILQSVMNGLNGTIFAYGQTNSGKTYTMQGSGTIEEGGGNSGGIVHMAARDIFSRISKDPQRIFLIRVSFIEIYNEEVRDLLARGNDGGVLAIREDPQRGVFVNATESFVTGYQSLLSILFAGEKKRSFAGTEMNERSSRSHTIFRINIESRKRPVTPCNGGSANEEDDGAVKVSTLNLIDLAGSESVKHTGATGIRQKEGAKINQSLLTLSRVIAALGSSSVHINFRDSKLTRILQPALSGNARIAIICCATPSELYLHETRNSLQFGSRAKLVRTRAKVNEVLDDRSLIKKLQQELALAKRASSESHTLSQVKALEIEAANANRKAEESEKNLQRLKLFILRGGLLHGFHLPQVGGQISAERHPATYSSANTYCNVTATSNDTSNKLSPIVKMSKPRRMSDSSINRTNVIMDTNSNILSVNLKANISESKSLADTKVKWMNQPEKVLARFSELSLLKEAFSSKAAIARSLRDKTVAHENTMREHDDLLSRATEDIALLKKSNDGAKSEVVELISKREILEEEKQRMIDTHATLLAERDAKNQDAVKAMERILADGENADSMLVSLQSQNKDLTVSAQTLRQEQDNEIKKLKKRIQELMSDNSKILQQHHRLEQEHISLRKNQRALTSDLDEKKELIKMEEEIVEDRSKLEQANIDKNGLEENDLHNNIVQPSNAYIQDHLNEKDKINIILDNKQPELKTYPTEQNATVLKLKQSLREADNRETALITDICSIKTSYEGQIQALNTKVSNFSNENETLSIFMKRLHEELGTLKSKHNMVLKNLAEQEEASILQNNKIQSLSTELSWVTLEKESLSDKLVQIWETL